MESISKQKLEANEVKKEKISFGGFVSGFIVGIFLFWLTVKAIQWYSW